MFVGCTPAGGDGTIDEEMINIEVSERERANQNYTFDTPTSLAELNGSSCCVRFVNGFCSSASCLEFGELPKMQCKLYSCTPSIQLTILVLFII